MATNNFDENKKQVLDEEQLEEAAGGYGERTPSRVVGGKSAL
ncbi:MAG: hypothetical protein ACI4B3_03515 [Prevotella sp.]